MRGEVLSHETVEIAPDARAAIEKKLIPAMWDSKLNFLPCPRGAVARVDCKPRDGCGLVGWATMELSVSLLGILQRGGEESLRIAGIVGETLARQLATGFVHANSSKLRGRTRKAR